MKKRADAVVSFAGSPDKIEWKAVPGAGYPIHPITVQGATAQIDGAEFGHAVQSDQGTSRISESHSAV